MLPRDCPRICLESKIYVSDKWKLNIENCTLFEYLFDEKNFKIIDSIAGYYVSEKTEVPLKVRKINDCIHELNIRGVELIYLCDEDMKLMYQTVVNTEKYFSIIKWGNM